MIPEVDAVLRSLLAATGAGVEFEIPATPRPETAVVALLLHGVREEKDVWDGGWSDQRDDAGRVVARTAPVRRYRLDYLATAWAPDVAREHAVVAAVLQTLAPVGIVPDEYLTDALRAAGEPLMLRVAHPDAAAPDWAALGVSPRPVLTVQVSAALTGPTVAVAAAPDAIELGVTGGRRAPVPAEPPVAPSRRVSEPAGGVWR